VCACVRICVRAHMPNIHIEAACTYANYSNLSLRLCQEIKRKFTSFCFTKEFVSRQNLNFLLDHQIIKLVLVKLINRELSKFLFEEL